MEGQEHLEEWREEGAVEELSEVDEEDDAEVARHDTRHVYFAAEVQAFGLSVCEGLNSVESHQTSDEQRLKAVEHDHLRDVAVLGLGKLPRALVCEV